MLTAVGERGSDSGFPFVSMPSADKLVGFLGPEVAVFEGQSDGTVHCRYTPMIMHGVQRRLLLSGLHGARLHFLPEPGTESAIPAGEPEWLALGVARASLVAPDVPRRGGQGHPQRPTCAFRAGELHVRRLDRDLLVWL